MIEMSGFKTLDASSRPPIPISKMARSTFILAKNKIASRTGNCACRRRFTVRQTPIHANGIEKKIIVNRHGIDLTRFKRQEESSHNHKPFTILSVGSLLECKGFSFLIEACAVLKDRGLGFRCIIAGGGKLEKNLRAQIQTLELNDTVELTSYITQDKLIPLYQQADVFVLAMVPEIHWGIPNVLIEAMAAGAAVVCTMLPSIPELIEDGKTGFIIPEKNPGAIASAVEKLYSDVTLRRNIVRDALKVVEEKFDTVKNARQLKELLSK